MACIFKCNALIFRSFQFLTHSISKLRENTISNFKLLRKHFLFELQFDIALKSSMSDVDLSRD